MTDVLGISGSLRRGSYNTALLDLAAELAPAGTRVTRASLDGIPAYNWDVEQESGFPSTVAALRGAVAGADAVLIACPEYNYSVTGVLKNALDWLSRPPDSPLNQKPVGIVGAGGRLGTIRAQLHLREILRHNAARVVERPEVLIPIGAVEWDDDRRLRDERYLDQTRRLLAALSDLVTG